ncbi:MAG TPA: hypothetical protein VIX17_27465 [Pyrinomonadaceae bacterium]|jgi:hypothetical protein
MPSRQLPRANSESTNCVHEFSPWADKGSKTRLWNEVANAIDYVPNGQGNDLPNFDD